MISRSSDDREIKAGAHSEAPVLLFRSSDDREIKDGAHSEAPALISRSSNDLVITKSHNRGLGKFLFSWEGPFVPNISHIVSVTVPSSFETLCDVEQCKDNEKANQEEGKPCFTWVSKHPLSVSPSPSALSVSWLHVAILPDSYNLNCTVL